MTEQVEGRENLISEAREIVQKTRRPGAWPELVKSLPESARGDPFLGLIEKQARKHLPTIDPLTLSTLADEYDRLREQIGLDPQDPTIDHGALIDFFLQRKGIYKPPPTLSRRRLLKAGAALAALTSAGGVGSLFLGPETPEKVSLFGEMIKPFMEEAHRRRLERAKNDPEYTSRIDTELNKNRVNFLLYGYGEEYARNHVDQPTFGSHSVFSIDPQARKFDVVSLTHDIRAPEIERYQEQKGKEARPTRIDKAYSVGGFKLMREAIENATGFSIDFQIVLEDTVIKHVVDNVFEGITVDVPFDIHTRGFRDEGRLYSSHHFSKGSQRMNGTQVLQFIKAWADPVDPAKERNVRKHIVMRTLFDELGRKIKERNLLFGIRAILFFISERLRNTIEFDFDEKKFLIPLLTGIGQTLGKSSGEFDVSIGRTVFIVDSAIGDGGVQWITANAHVNPLTKKDIEKGLYPPDLAMEVPFNANPYGQDLVKNYWQSVRQLIKARLLF